MHDTRSVKLTFSHIAARSTSIIRLVVETDVPLWRSVDPVRSFQSIALDPVPFDHVVEVQNIGHVPHRGL